MRLKLASVLAYGVLVGACGGGSAAPGPAATGTGGVAGTPNNTGGGMATVTGGGGAGGNPSTAGTGPGLGGGGSAALGGTGTGTAGSAVAGGAGGGDATAGTGGQAPTKTLNVTAPAAVYKHQFKPSAADALSTKQNDTQYAALDTTRPVLGGKLLVDVGHGLPELVDFFVHTGFHVLAIDFMGVDEVPDIIAAGAQSPDNYGNIRLEAFEGKDHTPLIDIDYHNSFEGHLIEGLKYLQDQYPAEDWGYYLNADGSPRYEDVILTGQSHGSSSVARFGMVRSIYRIVSTSGPRDNSCGTDPTCATGVIATWFDEVKTSKTPIDRFYAMAGTMDAEFGDITFAMERLGYLGKQTNVLQVAPPYGGSHRLIATDGHVRFCTDAKYAAACNLMFAVPAQNQ